MGTDIFHAAALLYVAGMGHWIAGNVDFALLGWLLLGSIPGVLIGGRLSIRIPEQALRLVLAGVLGLAGIKLLDVPGAAIIVLVVLSAGAVALLGWLGRHTWIRVQRGRNGGQRSERPPEPRVSNVDSIARRCARSGSATTSSAATASRPLRSREPRSSAW